MEFSDTEPIVHRYDRLYSRVDIVASVHFPAQFRFCLKLAGLRNPRTVLDVGGGTGAHSLALQAMGVDVTLLDSSGVAVERAAAHGVRHTVHADFFAGPLTGERFDVVLARSLSVFYTDDLDKFAHGVEQARRFAAPGGAVIFWSWSDLSTKWGKAGTYNHHPRSIDGFFSKLVAIPAFRVLCHLPIPATLAADAVLRASPVGLPVPVTLIGISR